jgi:hypothetical protein
MGGLRASFNLTTPDFDHDESTFPGLVRWRCWLDKRPPGTSACAEPISRRWRQEAR